jgi:hypothetical protein
MNDQRKGRNYFEEAPRPAGVTFDDAAQARRNLPWIRFAQADWDRSDPGTIRVEIGDWEVVISGHNLAPLFAAIERAQLARVQAHPEFADDPAHEVDVFATSIRFVRVQAAAGKGSRPTQLKLGLET